MKIQGKHLVAAILLVVSIGLAYDSLNNYVNPYLTVSDVVNNPSEYQGSNLQVMGTYVPGSMTRRDDGTLIFTLTDGTSDIAVNYKGTPPQDLESSESIVAIGKLIDDESMESNQLLVKCPSKYEAEQPQNTDAIFYGTMVLGALVLIYLAVTMFWKRG